MKNKLIKIGSIIAVVIVLVTMTVVPAFAWTPTDKDFNVKEVTSYPTTLAANTIYIYTPTVEENDWNGTWYFNETLVSIPIVSTTYSVKISYKNYINTSASSISLSVNSVVKFASTTVYNDGWVKESFRTITLNEEPTGADGHSFMEWLRKNATRTPPSAPKTQYIVRGWDDEVYECESYVDAVLALYQGTAEDFKDMISDYNSQLSSGLNTGSDSGNGGSYDEGLRDGKKEGYSEGLEVGEKMGFDKGFAEGVSSGFMGVLSDPLGAIFGLTIYKDATFELTLGVMFFTIVGILLFLAFLRFFGR